MNSGIDKKNERSGGLSFVFWLLIMLSLVGLDQLTKYLAFHGRFGSFLNALAPNVKKFHYFNHNFAFSLPLPLPLMYVIYVVILLAIFWYLYQNSRRLPALAKFAWVLILAGALSNIIERVALGYVRDFVYILSGIFNLADGFIIIGVMVLLLQGFKKSNRYPDIQK